MASTAPTIFTRLLPNRLLALLSTLLLAAVLAAIVRGQAHWAEAGTLVWVHMLTMLAALGLTPVLLLRAKGNRRHRQLGWAWAGLMLVSAALSLAFRAGHDGWGVFSADLSPIHALSLLVLVQAPRIVLKARAHDRIGHERAVRVLVVGALLLAGFFTFPLGRMLGEWLLG